MSDLTRFRDAPDAEGELARELLADAEWAEPPPAAEAAVWANLLVVLPPGALLPGAPAASGGGSAATGSGGSGIASGTGGAVVSGGASHGAGAASAAGSMGASSGAPAASAGIQVASAGALTKLALLGGTTKVFVASVVITGSGMVGWGLARDSLGPRSAGSMVEAVGAPAVSLCVAARSGGQAGPYQARPDDDSVDGASAEPRRSSATEPEPPGQVVPMGRATRKALPDPQSGGAASTPPVGSSGLNQESALLAAARGALRRGALGEAKRLLDEHQARFASGRLIQERQALRIEALWQAGAKDAARKQFEAYRRAYPGSPHTSRLGNLTGSLGSTGAGK